MVMSGNLNNSNNNSTMLPPQMPSTFSSINISPITPATNLGASSVLAIVAAAQAAQQQNHNNLLAAQNTTIGMNLMSAFRPAVPQQQQQPAPIAPRQSGVFGNILSLKQ
jgi:hypothetical protein